MRKFLVALSIAMLPFCCTAKGHKDSLASKKNIPETLQRVFTYKDNLTPDTLKGHGYVYTRFRISADKRNTALMFVPSMYVVARGRREYAGETYLRIDVEDNMIASSERILSVGTVPHNRTTMQPLLEYLIPTVYEETIGNDHLLSPFHKTNYRYYRYTVTPLTEGRAEIAFMPKTYNTQLISGTAIADMVTGKLLATHFAGEYDMISFHVNLDMGAYGVRSLFPKTITVGGNFSFIGNKVSSLFHTEYGIDKTFPDSIADSHDRAAMDSLRPEPLPAAEAAIYARYDSIRTAADSTANARKEHGKWKKRLWDVIGDNLVNRIRGTFGPHDEGYLRMSPILNPLYLDYNKNRGLSYKFKFRGRYDFSTNSNITLNIKGGYSFKLHEFYYRVPLRYTFNKKRDGYVEVEVGNGHRITTSDVVDKIKNTKADSINWNALNLDYFKQRYLKLTVNYNISDKWSIQPGAMLRHHIAIDKADFALADRPSEYKSFAPTIEVQYRPWGWSGLALTADYERGIKGVSRSATEYEKIEIDASWLRRITSVRSLSLRLGCGFYTSRSKDAYFLDYNNFREDNLSDGWDDDWTGNFQLLGRDWYNASEYYIRGNATYESPLMIVSHLPYVGRFIETERIYVSTLSVEHLHPYIELGYGFTNRLFSVGVFCATKNAKFDGIGARFEFELFRDW